MNVFLEDDLSEQLACDFGDCEVFNFLVYLRSYQLLQLLVCFAGVVEVDKDPLFGFDVVAS